MVEEVENPPHEYFPRLLLASQLSKKRKRKKISSITSLLLEFKEKGKIENRIIDVKKEEKKIIYIYCLERNIDVNKKKFVN